VPKPNPRRKRKAPSGFEYLLEIVSLEVVTEGVRDGIFVGLEGENNPDYRSRNTQSIPRERESGDGMLTTGKICGHQVIKLPRNTRRHLQNRRYITYMRRTERTTATVNMHKNRCEVRTRMVKLKFHGNSFLVSSSRGCRACQACRRGCYEETAP